MSEEERKAKQREYQATYRAKHEGDLAWDAARRAAHDEWYRQLSPERKKEMRSKKRPRVNAHQKEIYAQLKASGECVDGCGNKARPRLVRCAACAARALAVLLKWREKNGDKARERARKRAATNRRANYGITDEDWAAMFAAQGERCAICQATGLPDRHWHLDHEHVRGWEELPPETRKRYVRGILCHWCNAGLGHFRDDPDRMENAIRYIELSHRRLHVA